MYIAIIELRAMAKFRGRRPDMRRGVYGTVTNFGDSEEYCVKLGGSAGGVIVVVAAGDRRQFQGEMTRLNATRYIYVYVF